MSRVTCFSSAGYVDDAEKDIILRNAIRYYLKFEEFPRALCVAMELNDTETMMNIFDLCEDP